MARTSACGTAGFFVVCALACVLEWVHHGGAAGTLGVSQVLWDDWMK